MRAVLKQEEVLQMFYLLLLMSLYFSWQDAREQEISAKDFALFFLIIAAIQWQHLPSCLPFFLLALLARIQAIGIGEGDFCLLALYSLYFDWFAIWGIVFLASLLALFYLLVFRLFTNKWMKSLPFIPFLTMALMLYDNFIKVWLVY